MYIIKYNAVGWFLILIPTNTGKTLVWRCTGAL